jgi:hypothetical protein
LWLPMSGQNPGGNKGPDICVGKKGGHWVLRSQWIGVLKSLVYRREALFLVELVLDASAGSDHRFICCDPVLKLCQRWFTKEVSFGVGVEPLSVIG